MDAKDNVPTVAMYQQYLEEFRSEVADSLPSELAQHGATLTALSFFDNEDGVWVAAKVELPGQQEPWTRSRLIIPEQGPDKDAWLAGTIFSSALIKELDTR
ncbi:hypothetical protein [Streptomyces sp. A5-4]|uniref:hypothetical protein n=1 Tax=Streptomyces sp. A5-4 TaxID=3384771 RepID=UPI003DA9D3F8